MHITEMPQTSSDFAWWAFNVTFLALIWLMKQDLGRILREVKETKDQQSEADKQAAADRAACAERHKRLDYELVDIKERIKP